MGSASAAAKFGWELDAEEVEGEEGARKMLLMSWRVSLEWLRESSSRCLVRGRRCGTWSERILAPLRFSERRVEGSWGRRTSMSVSDRRR